MRGKTEPPSRGSDPTLAAKPNPPKSDPTLAAPSQPATDPTLASGTELSMASDATAAASSSVSPLADSGLTTVPASTYSILGEHGRGGLGRILRARDERTGRIVAIKEMLPGVPDAAPRFVREALVTANLQHPAIVPVYEVGRWPDGQPFYAMKLVVGHTLTEAITKTTDLAGRLSLLSHVAAVADALAYAHEAAVIHRDLKPANVLVGAHGETVVIDWGLAKTGDDHEIPLPEIASGETISGAVMGTPAYMPPEQATGVEVDARADVYAIGAMLYHLLAGVPPYADSRNAAEVITRVREGVPPRALLSLVLDVPPDLAAIVAKAMAHAPNDRYPSASELAADLRAFMTGGLVGAHSYTTWQRIARWTRRHRTSVAVAAIAVAALGGFGAYSVKRILRERDAAELARQESVERLAMSYEQRARTEHLAGHPERALPFAVEAMKLGRDLPGLRFLAARIAELMPPSAATFSRALVAAHFVPDSHDLIIATETSFVRWSSDTGKILWEVPFATPATIMPIEDAATSVFVASAKRVSLLELATGKVLLELEIASDKEVRDLQVSAKHVIATDSGGSLFIWDRASHALLHRLELGGVMVDVSLATDGARAIVTPYGDNAAPTVNHVIDVASGKVLFDACPKTSPCGRVRFLADGRILIAEDRESNLAPSRFALLDADGKQQWTRDTTTPIASFRVDGAGGIVATTGGLIESFELATGATQWKRQLSESLDDVELRSSRMLVSRPKHLTILDRNGAAEMVSYAFDLAGGKETLLSSDFQRIATVNYLQGIRVSPLDRVGDIITARPGVGSFSAAYTPDGARVLVGTSKGTIEIYRLADRVLERTLPAHGERSVASIHVAPDGKTFVSGSSDKHARIWSVADGKQLVDVDHGEGVRVVQFAPDGLSFLTGSKDGAIARWSAKDGSPIGTRFRMTARIIAARWSPNGRYIAAIDENGAFSVWNVQTGFELRHLDGSEFGNGTALAWSPDGRRIAVARHDAAPYLVGIEGASDVPLPVPDGGEFQALDAAFDPAGKRIAMSGMDGRIRIWDVETGVRTTTIDTDETGSWYIAWHPGGSLIATGDRVGLVRIWAADTGEELATRKALTEVLGIKFSPDGNDIVASSLEQGFVWHVPTWRADVAALARVAECSTGWVIDAGAFVYKQRPLEPCK